MDTNTTQFREMGLHYADGKELSDSYHPLHTQLVGTALVEAADAYGQGNFAIGCAIGKIKDDSTTVLAQAGHNAFDKAARAFIDEAEVRALGRLDQAFFTKPGLSVEDNRGLTIASTLEPIPGSVQAIASFVRTRPKGLITDVTFGASDDFAAQVDSKRSQGGMMTEELTSILKGENLWPQSFNPANIPEELRQACEKIFLDTHEEIRTRVAAGRENFYEN